MLFLTLATSILSLPAAVQPSAAPVERIERELALMGSALKIQVDAPERRLALSASEAAVRALEATELRLSTWTEDSELSRLNRSAVGAHFSLSPELVADLTAARHHWELTEGAFDPACGALVAVWGLRGNSGNRPSADERRAALVPGGFGALELDLEGGSALRSHASLVIEEGGFGKGRGLDAALEALDKAGAESAVLDLGGQIALYGDAGEQSFGVADPRERGADRSAVVELQIDRGSLATSGNTERGIVVDGERYGHLLDPESGRPVHDFGSLTVWAPDATAADCLSTGLYVLGPERALAFAAHNPGIEVLIIESSAAGLAVRASAGFGGRVQSVSAEVSIAVAPIQKPRLALSETLPVAAQDGDDQRLDELEDENDELSRRIDILADELERLKLGSDIAPPVGESENGFGPAASKVFGVESGLSIGGYGEFLYENFQGGDDDKLDALRAVLYFGYKFNEKWLFNSEIEIEHASTSDNPDGDDGSTSVEFAFIDYNHSEKIGFRGGLLLVPMGFINELHEPTTFLSAERPRTETVIIPTTFRENGAGVYGDIGDFSYRSYVVTSMEGKDFDAGGLRGGRQKGNRADAEDFSWVGRVDWTGVPGVTVGGSVFFGDQGQDVGTDAETTIYEAHVEWKRRGFSLRALAAMAEIDDVDELNAVADGGPFLGSDSIGEELEGYYVELGYDLMSKLDPGSEQSLTPFVRYEAVDTQAEVPSGFSSDGSNDVEILTVGVAYQPIDNVIIKVDYQDWDNDSGNARDQWNIALGYVF